jgi:hypothetical protein
MGECLSAPEIPAYHRDGHVMHHPNRPAVTLGRCKEIGAQDYCCPSIFFNRMCRNFTSSKFLHDVWFA